MKRYLIYLKILLSFIITGQAFGQNQTAANGDKVTANFPASGCVYNWSNSNPAIGLPATGRGNISFTAVNIGATAVMATITATASPTNFAYVADGNANNISIIDLSTNQVVSELLLAADAYAISVSADGSRVYVTSEIQSGPNQYSVSVIDTKTNAVIGTIALGAHPEGIVVSPDGSKAYVTNNDLSTVSVIDAVTLAVTATIAVENSPVGIAISPDGSKLYVANYNSNDISVISTATNKIINTINAVGTQPNYIAVSPDGNTLYVSCANSDRLSVINTLTNVVTASIPIGNLPYGVVVSHDGSRVYVINSRANSVSVINTATNTVIATTLVDAGPLGLSLSLDGKLLYVVDNNSVVAISTATNLVVADIPIDPGGVSLGNFVSPGPGCSGLPVAFTITINPSPVITSTGTLAAFNSSYKSASVPQSFTVSGARMLAGILVTPPPGFEVSTDGINYSPTLTVPGTGVIPPTTIYTRLSAASNAGAYSGNIVLSSLSAVKVNLNADGMINKASLTITANNQSRPYGEPNPALTIKYSGFVNGDDSTKLVKMATAATVANASSLAGNYPIIVGGAVSPNYNFIYVNGTLTITPVFLLGIPNAFTPNADGVNDTWNIKYIEHFPNCTVQVFNRSGQRVFYSIGYAVAWDGSYKNLKLPVDTYYYVIKSSAVAKPLSGWVTIIR